MGRWNGIFAPGTRKQNTPVGTAVADYHPNEKFPPFRYTIVDCVSERGDFAHFLRVEKRYTHGTREKPMRTSSERVLRKHA